VAVGVRWNYRSGTLLGIGVAGLALLDGVLLWSAQDGLRAGRTGTALVDLLWAAAITALVAEVFLRPMVGTRDHGVVLVNPYRTAVVPWAALERVDDELSLQLVTASRSYTSWAATGSRRARPKRRRWTDDDPDMVREQGGTSSSLTEVLRTKGMASITGATQCKLFIEEAWRAWRMSPAKASGGTTPRVRWHWGSAAVFCALVLAVAAGSAALS
jgi:hypothetical protein